MKKFLNFILPVFFIVIGSTVYAQQSKASVKVWGNCGMCKQVIEEAAVKSGASTANWDKNTKVLVVEFSDQQTDLKKIQMSVAASGYDTQEYKANDKAYSNLPGCCQYTRKDVASKKTSNKATCEKCGMECKDGCKDPAVCKSKGCAHKS